MEIDLPFFIELIQQTSEEILAIYHQDFSVENKADLSPITLADKKVNEIILSALKKKYPTIPIISEETSIPAYEIRKNWEYFFMVDPLDGTKEFIQKNDEFTINIALIKKDSPIFGIVGIPCFQEIYYGIAAEGSFKIHENKTTKINASPSKKTTEEIKVAISKSHLDDATKNYINELKKKYPKVNCYELGSSLKFCKIAEGIYDCYPRFSPTMEWDTAAAHAVVKFAGKEVIDFNTKLPLLYNKKSLVNSVFIVQ